MKVIIAGGRDFTDYEKLSTFCDKVLANTSEVEIVSGVARGADILGEIYAEERGYPVKQFPADWNTHGKSAGHKRNAQMADYADALVAFWDGSSKGTLSMINLAKSRNLMIRIFIYILIGLMPFSLWGQTGYDIEFPPLNFQDPQTEEAILVMWQESILIPCPADCIFRDKKYHPVAHVKWEDHFYVTRSIDNALDFAEYLTETREARNVFIQNIFVKLWGDGYFR